MKANLESVLNQLLTAVDDWINENVDEYNPFLGDDVSEKILRRKSFDEMAFLMFIQYNMGETGTYPKLEEQTRALANSPEYIDLLRRNPVEFLLYAYPALYLKEIGEQSELLGQAMDDMLKHKGLVGRDFAPFRAMDLWYVCDQYGHRPNPIDPSAVIAQTTLNRDIDFFHFNRTDAYTFTHNAFYWYNFGMERRTDPTHAIHSRDHSLALHGLMFRYLAAGDFDLLLELVVTGVIMRQISKDFIIIVLQAVANAFNRYGLIPSPQPIEAHSTDQLDTISQAWALNYHTMLVAALAMRVLKQGYDTADELCSIQLKPGLTMIKIFTIGQIVHQLNNYDLVKALELMITLPQPDQEEDCITDLLFQKALDFLQTQISASGTLGLFVDERSQSPDFDAETQSVINKLYDQLVEKTNRGLPVSGT